jgi:hypothetical protein
MGAFRRRASAFPRYAIVEQMLNGSQLDTVFNRLADGTRRMMILARERGRHAAGV